MLNQKQIDEIKEFLARSQNPLFFFDNDCDGLASFLILARAYGKGRGVAIKSSPALDSSYIRKIHELNPDAVFILDKPLVEQAFIDETRKMNLPIIWIDHHEVSNPLRITPENSNENFHEMDVEKQEGVYYYNSKLGEKSSEPTTYWSYKIAGKKEDLWLAVVGCIADNYLPEFSEEFAKQYPELWTDNARNAFQVLYDSEIGKITRILGACLKDKTSNVLRMIRFLLKISSPQEILNEEDSIFSRFKQIDKKYQKLLEKAEEFVKDKILYFQYGGDLSISSDLANELSYKHPGKTIVVAYISGTKANISIRSKKAKEITLKAIEGFENATGGGHEQATGAKILVEDLPKFKERIEKLVG